MTWLWDLKARPVAASKWSTSHCDALHSGLDSAHLKRQLFLTISQGPWWGLNAFFSLRVQVLSQSLGEASQGSKAQGNYQVTIQRTSSSNKIPLKRPKHLKWHYTNLLKTAPRFSSDSHEKGPFDLKISNLCVVLCHFNFSNKLYKYDLYWNICLFWDRCFSLHIFNICWTFVPDVLNVYHYHVLYSSNTSDFNRVRIKCPTYHTFFFLWFKMCH